MEKKEKISVSLRFRPLNSREKNEKARNIWSTSKNAISLKSTYIDKFL